MLNLALGVVVTALVARLLGSAGYGQWSTLFILLTLTGYIVNFGMEGIVVREAAREPEAEHEWLGAMMLLRILVIGPVVALTALLVVLLHRSHGMLIAGLILMVAMPFGGMSGLQLIFQLRVNNLVPMLVMSLRSVLWAAAVGIIYATGGGMIALAIALAVTNSVGSIVQVLAALRLVERRPRPSARRLGALLRACLPLGISGALVIAYARIDQVIVFSIAGSHQAGLYGSVYNILDQSHFVPISILTTLSPIIAASWPGDRTRMLRAARMTAELMAVASFGALAFAIVAAGPLVRFIFGGAFVAAAPALPVLGGAFVLICFGYLNANVLVVLGLQKRLLAISLAALAVNVAGNLALVPAYGFMAAAWMTLATEAVVFALSLALIVRRLETGVRVPVRVLSTAFAAALLCGGLALLKDAGASLAVLIVVASAGYPALLFGLRALGPNDVRLLLRRGATV